VGLAIPEVVGTLDALDLLDLDEPGPWPGEPEGESVRPIDWTSVEKRPGQRETGLTDPWYHTGRSWERVRQELQSRGKGVQVPPPDVFDALAWYLPIHYYGYGYGIYIRESAVLERAAAILSRFEPSRRGELDAIEGVVRAGLAILYLHEAFHHKVESFAIRLEIVEHGRRYHPYFKGVFGPLRAAGSDELLEEALACADIIRRMRTENVYQRSIPSDIQHAAQAYLLDWLPTLPTGYRKAPDYLKDPAFDQARNILSSQIHEGRQHPMRRADEWHLMPHSYHGLFDCKTVTHVLVPVGTTPLIPWFGEPLALSMSTEAVKRVISAGYAIVPGGGKGSHIKLRAAGRPMIIIPANRKSLSPNVLNSVKTALDLRSVKDLLTALNPDRSIHAGASDVRRAQDSRHREIFYAGFGRDLTS